MDNHYTLSNFLPLILIDMIVILLTITTQFLWPTSSLIANFMGYFFLIFGSFKMYNLRAFAKAYAEYDIIAKKSHAYALFYPCIELGLGISYLLSLAPMATNFITLFIMIIGSVGVIQALARHKTIPCACLGVVFNIPMTYVSLLEDIVMACMALIMLISDLL